ncbi:MAG: hypothetical protein QM541_11740 [Flavobacterium sp.]|nr:hypothetical protein [Flavobacterium sp.]
MIIQPFYHVDPFYNNRLLHFKIFLLEKVAFIKKTFSITAFKTGYVKSLNGDLGNLLITLKGVRAIVNEFDKSKSKEEYRLMVFAIKKYNKIYSILMGIKFFNDSSLEETCTQILDEMYSIELELKKKAFENEPNNNNDAELINYASYYSRNTLNTFN